MTKHYPAGNRHELKRGRAKTRYLTQTGHILKGTELFRQRDASVQVMAIHQHELGRFRAMTHEERKKKFDPNKAWSPAGLAAVTKDEDNGRNQASAEGENQGVDRGAEPSGESAVGTGSGEAGEEGKSRFDGYDLSDGLDHDGGSSPG
jgi:hypothetical protein